MANDLGSVVSKFTTKLDGILEKETVTSDLNMNQDLLGELQRNGEIKIAKMEMDGLGDHVRGGGFTAGSIRLLWETMHLEFERDREFEIDILDDEERELIITANLMAEFARTKVVPEVDAIRFARLAANAGNTETATFTTPEAATAAVIAAEEVLEDAGKALASCVLYVTSATKTLLRKGQPWRIGQGESPQTNFETYDGMKMVVVPSDRFYTAIDLFDGRTSGETSGGYEMAAEGGAGLNFMVVNAEACGAITKHEKLRYFSPEVHQGDETHLWQYRLYHDLLVYENKANLIYASIKG